MNSDPLGTGPSGVRSDLALAFSTVGVQSGLFLSCICGILFFVTLPSSSSCCELNCVPPEVHILSNQLPQNVTAFYR